MQTCRGILVAPCQFGFGRRTGGRLAAREVVEQMVALQFGVGIDEMRAPTRRSAPVALARQVAMYLLHVACGLTLTEVGDLCGRDRTTVAHACSIVEDRRDDTGFDDSLENLESGIARISQAFRWLQSRGSA